MRTRHGKHQFHENWTCDLKLGMKNEEGFSMGYETRFWTQSGDQTVSSCVCAHWKKQLWTNVTHIWVSNLQEFFVFHRNCELAWLLSLLMWFLVCLCVSFYKCEDFSMQFHLSNELGYKRPLVLSVAKR
jgi:hypothetical protein